MLTNFHLGLAQFGTFTLQPRLVRHLISLQTLHILPNCCCLLLITVLSDPPRLQHKQILIEIINYKARHNLINVKYIQMVFRSVGGTVVGSFWETLGQTKVMHNHQRELSDYMKFVVQQLNLKSHIFLAWLDLASKSSARTHHQIIVFINLDWMSVCACSMYRYARHFPN